MANDGLKIVQLTAENVKRLRAIDIAPDPTMQVIAGRNAQGKTSVLDAIWLALGGGTAKKGTAKPVRDGETSAKVRLDLGQFVVTRTWDEAGRSNLRVESADGANYSSPQSMLDALIGKLSFDPLAFTRLSAREQRAALMDLVDLEVDIDALDAERARLYEERTQIGREGKALGEVVVDESLPVEEESATSLIQEIRDANEVIANRRRLNVEADDVADDICRLEGQIKQLEAELADQRAELRSIEVALEKLPDVPDVDALNERLSRVEDTNIKIRYNNQARETSAKKARLLQRYEARTAEIEAIDKKKSQALARAVFPVDGLGFDTDGVTYRGIPFSQASAAEQIRVSLAMAMAANSKLRVIRILDGSLLDDENLAIIRSMAADGGYQIWIERVGEDDETAVIIEDGQVKQ